MIRLVVLVAEKLRGGGIAKCSVVPTRLSFGINSTALSLCFSLDGTRNFTSKTAGLFVVPLVLVFGITCASALQHVQAVAEALQQQINGLRAYYGNVFYDCRHQTQRCPMIQ